MKKGTRWQYKRGKGRRENKRKIGELEEKWGYEIQKEIFCIFCFLFKKMIKLLKLLWYHLSLVYAKVLYVLYWSRCNNWNWI